MAIGKHSKKGFLVQFFICTLLVLLTAGGCFIAEGYIGYKVVALILLMIVSINAMLFDIFPVLFSAVLSALLWNFFFIPPLFTFHVDNAEDLMLFSMYFIVALLNAVLNFKIRKEQKKSYDKEEKEKTIQLYNTLFNSLSHELKTPISTIIGSVDTLKENLNTMPDELKKELLLTMEKAGTRLNRQVENLLNMSRLETGLLKLNLVWCDLNDFVFSTINKIEDKKKHTVAFEPNDKTPLVKIDEGLMEQVLLNLLHNAINYTEENTTIRIVVHVSENHFVLQVQDEGKGISVKDKPYVFDKFYRSNQKVTGGSGLGLSIVKGFVNAHGGTVELDSTYTKGSNFICRIPTEVNYLNRLKNE